MQNNLGEGVKGADGQLRTFFDRERDFGIDGDTDSGQCLTRLEFTFASSYLNRNLILTNEIVNKKEKKESAPSRANGIKALAPPC